MLWNWVILFCFIQWPRGIGNSPFVPLILLVRPCRKGSIPDTSLNFEWLLEVKNKKSRSIGWYLLHVLEGQLALWSPNPWRASLLRGVQMVWDATQLCLGISTSFSGWDFGKGSTAATLLDSVSVPSVEATCPENDALCWAHSKHGPLSK